jgi:tRNA threonylcarbamoyladenosine biosynthesis protein TsaB
LILAIETSGDWCSVAVASGNDLLREVVFRHERQLLERLPDTVESVLSASGIDWTQIDRIAAGIGPGSFTGVRVAVTFAKTWAWALGIPVAGVPSLEAAAIDLPEAGPVVGLAPCRAGQVIAWFGDDDYRVLEIESFERTARELHPVGSIALVGDAAAVVPIAAGFTVVGATASAAQVARLAALPQWSDRFGAPHDLNPLYVAPPPIRGHAGIAP